MVRKLQPLKNWLLSCKMGGGPFHMMHTVEEIWTLPAAFLTQLEQQPAKVQMCSLPGGTSQMLISRSKGKSPALYCAIDPRMENVRTRATQTWTDCNSMISRQETENGNQSYGRTSCQSWADEAFAVVEGRWWDLEGCAGGADLVWLHTPLIGRWSQPPGMRIVG